VSGSFEAKDISRVSCPISSRPRCSVRVLTIFGQSVEMTRLPRDFGRKETEDEDGNEERTGG
jgi:hypothetical protein